MSIGAVPGISSGGWGIGDLRLQQVSQFVDRKLNIAQDRTQQAETNRLTGMYRNCGGSAVRVSKERMTSAGPVHREACSFQCPFPKIRGINSEVQKQILRLTTPKLKSVWGPFRSG